MAPTFSHNSSPATSLPIKFSARWKKKLTLCRLSYCSNCLHYLVVVELFLTLTKKFTASSSVHLGPVGRGGHDIACSLVISFTVLQLTLGRLLPKNFISRSLMQHRCPQRLLSISRLRAGNSCIPVSYSSYTSRSISASRCSSETKFCLPSFTFTFMDTSPPCGHSRFQLLALTGYSSSLVSVKEGFFPFGPLQSIGSVIMKAWLLQICLLRALLSSASGWWSHCRSLFQGNCPLGNWNSIQWFKTPAL